MPAIINAPSSAWFVLRDLAEGADPKAPFYRPSPVGKVPTAAEIREFYERLRPATGKLYMSGFDPSTYPLGEGWANRLSDNAWEAVVSAAELLNSGWSIGKLDETVGGAIGALSELGDKLFNPVFAGITLSLPNPFISNTLRRAIVRYLRVEEQVKSSTNRIDFEREVTDGFVDTPLDPLIEYRFLRDRPHSVIVGAQSPKNPFASIFPHKVDSPTSGLIRFAMPDKTNQWGYAAPLNWWSATITPETIPLAQGISNLPNASLGGVWSTWFDLNKGMLIGPHSYPDQARRILTAKWHHEPDDISYILNALDAINRFGGGDTIFARSTTSPDDTDVLNLINTMGIYPPIIALPFDLKYKIGLFAKKVREGTPVLSQMILNGITDTRWSYLAFFGPGLLTLMLTLRSANKYEEKIANLLDAVADILCLAAEPQAAINDTLGYLLCAVLTFFRRATKLLGDVPGGASPSVNELCRTTLGLTDRQLEQMIRSLGSASDQSLNSATNRLAEDDWGYVIRMDRTITESVLSTSNFNRSDLIYPVYCIDPELLSLPFKKSFEPLVYVSRWATPGGAKGPTSRVGVPRRIFDSETAAATTAEVETASTDPTLQFVQTINLASLLLECGFEAEGFTGILSRLMSSNGSLGHYLREFIGGQIAYAGSNDMLNGYSISTVVRYLWRQMITDEFVVFYAHNYRDSATFSDTRGNNDDWLWTVIPWMRSPTRRKAIQQVMGELDFSRTFKKPNVPSSLGNFLAYSKRRVDVSDLLPEGSILYRLSGDEGAEPGTAFERWQDLPREDRDTFHLFMQEMAKCDQELIALAEEWMELRANPSSRHRWIVQDFEPVIAEPEPPDYADPDSTRPSPRSPITPEQLILMAFSATPSWSRP